LQIKAISEAKWDSYVFFRMGRNGIIGYNGGGGELVIPDSIWDEPITSIGENVFKYKGITRITIGKNASYNNKDKGIFLDLRDGKKYEYVKIGEQTWMAENLNYNVYGSRCHGDNTGGDSQNICGTYGRLYNWSTAMGFASSCNTRTCSSQIQPKHQGICPVGWHIPNQAEWNVLGDDARKLKATSSWNSGGNGTDQYGFSALPGGYGYSNGSFHRVGNDGNWWSASEDNSNSAYLRYMYYSLNEAYWNDNSKSYLQSIRCVQD
jgi:uncharacterized protein (TIGR02145 family)